MTKKEIMYFREMLIKQYREIFKKLHQLEPDWQNLGIRKIDLFEAAQETDETGFFDQLDESVNEEIKEIDLAFYKIVAGNYGICERCRKAISSKRLEMLPTARLCGQCMSSYQKKQKNLTQAREIIEPAELPVDYQNLNDRDLELSILDNLKNDGRLDLEQLEISCRKGVVYLEGIIPSEIEHQILLRTLTDVMGFSSIIAPNPAH